MNRSNKINSWLIVVSGIFLRKSISKILVGEKLDFAEGRERDMCVGKVLRERGRKGRKGRKGLVDKGDRGRSRKLQLSKLPCAK